METGQVKKRLAHDFWTRRLRCCLAAYPPYRLRMAEQRSIGSRTGCRWRKCSPSIPSLRPAKKPRGGGCWMRKARVKSTQERSGLMYVHADKQTTPTFIAPTKFRSPALNFNFARIAVPVFVSATYRRASVAPVLSCASARRHEPGIVGPNHRPLRSDAQHATWLPSRVIIARWALQIVLFKNILYLLQRHSQRPYRVIDDLTDAGRRASADLPLTVSPTQEREQGGGLVYMPTHRKREW
ncbi:hypothetical protein D9619_013685 [Psilocybe cf. subviscida]|uniref:Uncharacterized protein n=1 Tax=Psilocybe cf. subviscida TaxID=2480587 RepID=A0A8H5B004_9AGAR|nr:hypothetical protein D9619_013685 [Psilocybe cf. subviscida]